MNLPETIELLLENLSPILKFVVPTFLIVAIVLSYTHKIFKQYDRDVSRLYRFLLYIISFAYSILIFYITFLYRNYNNEYEARQIILAPLSSYRLAWYSYSSSEWCNIIINILMFIPFGFLIPLYNRKFRSLIYVVISTLFLTTTIELAQLITRKGIFEIDDLINNMLGAIIGYGLILFILNILDKKKLRSTVYLVPSIATIILFFVIQFSYNSQSIGNLSCTYSYKVDMSKVEIQSRYNTEHLEKNNLPIYQNAHFEDMEYGKELMSRFQKELRLPVENTPEFDTKNITIDGEYLLDYNIQNGQLLYNSYLDKDKEIVMISESDARVNDLSNRLLKIYHSDLVDSAVNLEGNKENDFVLNISKEKTSDEILEGQMSFSLDNNLKIHYLESNIKLNKYVKNISIISLDEAFSRLRDGQFKTFPAFEKGDKLSITDYKIEYTYDSKGFYRPVYLFCGYLNGDEWSVYILAD
jgi:glycopeptide antibiotics resistance protein/uncharacterized protein (DUF1778 family)